ncbi:MAG: acyl-CoA thioesterase [Candidatus Thermochlorobacter sp.]
MSQHHSHSTLAIQHKPKVKAFEFSMPIDIMPHDIDYAGVVSNITYVRWLEVLRVKMIESYLSVEAQLKMDISPVLLKTEIHYKKAVKFLDKLIGKMWISHATQLRWTASAEFLVEGKPVAHAEQLGIFIKLSTMRPVPIPAELMRVYHEAERRLRHHHH